MSLIVIERGHGHLTYWLQWIEFIPEVVKQKIDVHAVYMHCTKPVFFTYLLPFHRCTCALHHPVDWIQDVLWGHRVCINYHFYLHQHNYILYTFITHCNRPNDQHSINNLHVFLYRCWDINEDSRYWWIIKGPIVVSIAVNAPIMLKQTKGQIVNYASSRLQFAIQIFLFSLLSF